MNYSYKYKNGIFLARMQPLHMQVIEQALQECERLIIILGSSNKEQALRNPFSISQRTHWLFMSLIDKEDFDRIKIFSLSDWSYENDTNENNYWGRYLYYNIVSRIQAKTFTIYYSDDPEIIKSWLYNTEVEKNITLRLLDRNGIFDGLSATKIRQAIIDKNIDYLERYLTKPVLENLEEIREYYLKIIENPKEDFSMI